MPFSVVGPTASRGSTGENDCNSPQGPAAVIHSHGRVWQWRKQDRVLQILNGQRNWTVISARPATGQQGACPRPLDPPSRPPLPPTRRPSCLKLTALAALSKLNLSSAAHSSDHNCSCGLALCYPRARSTKIWPRGEGHYALRGLLTGPSFSCPVSFLVLYAPGKGKQQKTRLESPHNDEA